MVISSKFLRILRLRSELRNSYKKVYWNNMYVFRCNIRFFILFHFVKLIFLSSMKLYSTLILELTNDLNKNKNFYFFVIGIAFDQWYSI